MDVIYPARIITFPDAEMTSRDFSVLAGMLASEYSGVLQGCHVAGTNLSTVRISSGWVSVGGVLVYVPAETGFEQEYDISSVAYLNLYVDLTGESDIGNAAYMRVEAAELSNVERGAEVASYGTFGISLARIVKSSTGNTYNVYPLNRALNNATLFHNLQQSFGVIERYGVPLTRAYGEYDTFMLDGLYVRATSALSAGTILQESVDGPNGTASKVAWIATYGIYDQLAYRPGETLNGTFNCYGWLTGAQKQLVIITHLPKVASSRVSGFTLSKLAAADAGITIKIGLRVGGGYAIGGDARVIKVGADNITSISTDIFSGAVRIVVTSSAAIVRNDNVAIANNTPLSGTVQFAGTFS